MSAITRRLPVWVGLALLFTYATGGEGRAHRYQIEKIALEGDSLGGAEVSGLAQVSISGTGGVVFAARLGTTGEWVIARWSGSGGSWRVTSTRCIAGGWWSHRKASAACTCGDCTR